jgi:outer membrane protein assembly factor BamD
MSNALKSLLLLMIATLFLGCSEYSKIVKNDNYDEKLQKAESMYAARSFNRALVLYEQVYQRYPREGRGEIAYFRLAQCYWEIEDYFMAGYYFRNFVTRFPFSPKAEESLFMSAMCAVKNSPEPALDQEETLMAINELQLFVNRYPESELVDSCNSVMDAMRFKLETKAFNAVELYAKTERYQAAVVSAKTFIDEYPQSIYRETAALIMLENAFILADNSIFSRKKERLEDVLEIYTNYSSDLNRRRYQTRANEFYKRTADLLVGVDEQVAFNELLSTFAKTGTESKRKKIQYLEETIKRYYNFVDQYPNSQFMKKATDTFEKAQKELANLS